MCCGDALTGGPVKADRARSLGPQETRGRGHEKIPPEIPMGRGPLSQSDSLCPDSNLVRSRGLYPACRWENELRDGRCLAQDPAARVWSSGEAEHWTFRWSWGFPETSLPPPSRHPDIGGRTVAGERSSLNHCPGCLSPGWIPPH